MLTLRKICAVMASIAVTVFIPQTSFAGVAEKAAEKAGEKVLSWFPSWQQVFSPDLVAILGWITLLLAVLFLVPRNERKWGVIPVAFIGTRLAVGLVEWLAPAGLWLIPTISLILLMVTAGVKYRWWIRLKKAIAIGVLWTYLATDRIPGDEEPEEDDAHADEADAESEPEPPRRGQPSGPVLEECPQCEAMLLGRNRCLSGCGYIRPDARAGEESPPEKPATNEGETPPVRRKGTRYGNF